MDKPHQERSPAEREVGLGLIGGLSVWHWLIVLVVVVVLFGRGRISEVMGDFGKGIKSFRRGISEDSPPVASAATPGERESATRTTGNPNERPSQRESNQR